MSKKNGDLIPAVAYIRMSTDMQTDSPKQQKDEIRKLARRGRYDIIRWYEDLGISGDEVEKRPQFCRMLADASALADFKVILCWDQDRFGRFDSLRAGFVIDPLRRIGVRLVTVAQGEIDWEDFAGRMMYSILQEGKHQYLRDLSRNVVRGMIETAKAGTRLVAPPYGYDKLIYNSQGDMIQRVQNGQRFSKPKEWKSKLDISNNHQAVETVRWLFRTFMETDCTTRSLARSLNQRSIKNGNGNCWRHEAVKRILTNPVYVGDYAFGFERCGKYYELGEDCEINKVIHRDIRLRRKEAPIHIQDHHPAIIDRKIFDRCQTKLAERKLTSRRPRNNCFLLSGLLFCGCCGSRMHGARYSKREGKYYRCPGSTGSSNSCKGVNIGGDDLEKCIIAKLLKLMDKSVRQRLKQAISKRVSMRNMLSLDQAGTLEKQLKQLDRRIERGAENLLLADAGAVQAAGAKLGEWKLERDKMAKQLKRMSSTKKRKVQPSRVIENANKELKRLGQAIGSLDCPKTRELFRSVFSRITINWEAPEGQRNRIVTGVRVEFNATSK